MRETSREGELKQMHSKKWIAKDSLYFYLFHSLEENENVWEALKQELIECVISLVLCPNSLTPAKWMPIALL